MLYNHTSPSAHTEWHLCYKIGQQFLWNNTLVCDVMWFRYDMISFTVTLIKPIAPTLIISFSVQQMECWTNLWFFVQYNMLATTVNTCVSFQFLFPFRYRVDINKNDQITICNVQICAANTNKHFWQLKGVCAHANCI